ncbi:putative eukaryotic translation initiation factor 3 subunit B [Helianthus annuus]|nr:putative eukaryotic translation initiation factor 3 subunit B [Helianthus annuus]
MNILCFVYQFVPHLCTWIFSDDDDLNEEDSLEFNAGFGNIIIVDNLPIVRREKFEKLEGVVRKIYSQIGVIKENGLLDACR